MLQIDYPEQEVLRDTRGSNELCLQKQQQDCCKHELDSIGSIVVTISSNKGRDIKENI